MESKEKNSPKTSIFAFILIVIAVINITAFFMNKKKNTENNVVNQVNNTVTESDDTEDNKELEAALEEEYEEEESDSVINSVLDIELVDADGNDKNYTFKYKGEAYSAIYTTENWKVVDSYKITNRKDITLICKALLEVHPIHGRDYTSYREPEDMAYEWVQHNIAYQILPEDHRFKNNAKDVDLNPEDQGKNMIEMYEEKTGEKFSINSFRN